MQTHPVVNREDWLSARRALLQQEKDAVRQRDALNAARLALPWQVVDKPYVFDTERGPRSLEDLFDGRSQLIIYHFMHAPEWEAGCTGCSILADHFDGALPHLVNHDVSFYAVSRAPMERILAYKKRMGWRFPWVSSFGNDFNYDYHVSFTQAQLDSGAVFYNFADTPVTDAGPEMPGMSVFATDESGAVFHTYSAYTRGLEEMIGAFMFLDRAPKGRNETTTMDWVRRHDEYADSAPKPSCCD